LAPFENRNGAAQNE